MRLCDSPTPRRWRSIWGGAQDISAIPTVGRAVYSPVVTSVRLPRSTPQAQGVDATGVADLVVSAQAHTIDMHGLMIARHGRVIAQGSWRPYQPQTPTLVYSMSKALTATAIAMAEHDGLLLLSDPILDHLDLDPRSVSAHWSEVTVEHCLSMTVGYDAESSGLVHDRMGAGDRVGDEDWLHRVLSSPPTSEPGSVFHYCQAPTYLLSRIHRHVTGRGLVESLTGHLPEAFPPGSLLWSTDPTGHELGYSGAHLTTEAMLSLAQLYLDDGRWSGRAVLAADWVSRATTMTRPHPTRAEGPDWSAGYGYGLWGQRFGYRADGAYGQLALVVPDASLAVAITAETDRPQALLDLVWTHLLPAVDRAGSDAADTELAALLASRRSPIPSGHSTLRATGGRFTRSPGSTLPSSWTGVTVQTDTANAQRLVTLHRGGDALPLHVAHGGWRESVLEAGGHRLRVAAAGGWLDEVTYAVDVVLTRTPHRFRITANRATGLVDLKWRLPTLAGLDPFFGQANSLGR